MLTRYALFEGTVKEGQTPAFRSFVNENLVPLWTTFDGAVEVRVMFGEERDEGAPEFPLILAISYPDKAAMERALSCEARFKSREVTGILVERYFDGRIHHHVTSASEFPVKV
uniref:hypothetical protein n=1 Tax=Pararhizobium sp. IMCC3301 TaxID=3067904 RepID=UPI0027419E6B|nr:hypothetical protein [Pararhizobium sp. IMCC3301]